MSTGVVSSHRPTVAAADAPARPAWRRWAGPAAGVALLVVLVVRLGPQPFLDGLRQVDAVTVLAALAISAVTTTACAWRWHRIATDLDVDVPLRPAVAAYYRSMFLNSVLPGGVVGDVHRGIDHGRRSGSTARSLRAVGWDRLSGQTVQVAATALVLVLVPSPVRAAAPWVVAAAVLGALAVVLLPRLPAGSSRPRRWLAVAGDDVRRALLTRRALVVVALSLVVVAGQALVFLLAARAAGAPMTTALVPVALLVLVAMAVPLHIAGWGLREGAAAWAFAAVGLGADLGVRTAVVYGVVATAATLPGLVVIAVAALRRSRAVNPPVPREVVLDG